MRGSGWACRAVCYARFSAHLRLDWLGVRVGRLLDTPRDSLPLLDILAKFCLSVSLFNVMKGILRILTRELIYSRPGRVKGSI